jgi:hypothetical protein
MSTETTPARACLVCGAVATVAVTETGDDGRRVTFHLCDQCEPVVMGAKASGARAS